jgi:hypothetical protein
MKKISIIGLFAVVFILGFTAQNEECDRRVLSVSCKKKLENYKYDSQNFAKINFGPKPQQLEVEIPVFIGEKYRLVFNSSYLPKPIKIKVFTKDKTAKKREPIFSNENAKPDENELVFEVSLTKKMFIDYEIPADTTGLSGCMMFMVGYK